MSYVDALFDRNKDRIYIVERVNGQREYKEYPANYTFYYDDPRGKFRTIYDTPVSRFSTRVGKEFHMEVRINSGKRIWESDINPVFRCLEENYLGQKSPKLQTAFFDIEVDFDPVRGFSRPEDPFNPITAVSVYLDWLDKLVTMVIPPKSMSWETAEEICKQYDNCFLMGREEDLLKTFLDLIDDADILSGWNSEGFDIPYMVQRTNRVLSKDDTRRFCLWGQFPKQREFERFGASNMTFDLIGRVHMDYMQLYRKYTYEERHSYSLDAICEYELNESKTQYEGTLDQLYNKDFEKFIEYNRQDTALLHNYITTTTYPGSGSAGKGNIRVSNESVSAYFPDRWVSKSGNNDNGSGTFGRKAVRKVIVAQLKSEINTNQAAKRMLAVRM